MLPFLVGQGPAEFSTSLTLVPVFHLPYDTNGYYRELGVSPFATRQGLRRAYQRKKGWRSPRLTYILKQLLDPAIRRSYDATPMGSLFLDAYVERQLRRERMKEVVALREQGEIELAEMMADSPMDFDLDEALSRRIAMAIEEQNSPRPERWPWSYYRWGSMSSDTERLKEWMSLLILALNDLYRGRSTPKLAVGFVGHAPFEVTVVGYRTVAFLGDFENPTEELARQAADRVKHTVNLGG